MSEMVVVHHEVYDSLDFGKYLETKGLILENYSQKVLCKFNNTIILKIGIQQIPYNGKVIKLTFCV